MQEETRESRLLQGECQSMKQRMKQWLRSTGLEEQVRNVYYRLLGPYIPKRVVIHGEPSRCYVSSAQAADHLHVLPEEEVVQHWFISQLKPDDNVWDIGANVGQWAICCARAVPRGRVCLFEPQPDLARLLRKTLLANGFEHADVLCLALGDKDGEALLYVGVDDSSVSSLHPRADNLPVQSSGLPVQVASSSGIVREGLAPLPQAVKLDAEGAELAILRGFDQPIWDSLRLLMVEVHPLLLPEMGGSKEDVKDLLARNGFIVEHIKYRSTVELWMCRKSE